MATAPFALPFELQAESSGLDRKQALIQTLMSGLMAPRQGQMVSGHYVGPGWAGALAPLAGAFLGGRAQDGLEAGRKSLTQKYNSGLAGAMEQYFKSRDGTPGDLLSDSGARNLLVNDTDQSAGLKNDGSAANPRRAAIEALTSGYAPLNELGKSDLAELNREALQDRRLAAAAGTKNKGMSTKEILALAGQDKYDPASVQQAALAGDIGLLRPSSREHTVNGQLVAGNPGGGYKTVFDGRDRFGAVAPVAPGVMGQTELGTGKVHFAPGGGTTINVDTKAGNKFAEKLAEGRATAITKSFESAQSAVKALDALNVAQADFNAGIKSGITGNISLGLSKFGKALGLPDDPAIANTEAYRANMARETLNLVKGLGSGTGISNADREFAEKASGGSITLDDAAMQRLMNVAKAAAANTVMEHKRLLGAQTGASGTLPADLESFRIPLNVLGGDGLDFDPRLQKFVTSGAAGTPAAPSSKPRRVRFEDLK